MGDVDTWLSSLPRHITIHWTIKQAARLLTVSKTLQRRIERHGIVARAAMSLPNVFDPTLFHPDPSYHREPASPLHLLWVGGFKPDYYRRKGGPDLLHAVALAYPHLKQAICLTLIGGGPARGECETLARNLGIADTCHFLGELPYTQVRDQMQHCDALVLASLSESFGAVIIEAMACGKPVIATRCGGPEEIVTPETGLLIEPGDKQALAEAIIELSTTIEAYDPEHIVAHVYRHYHPERVANKLTHVYNEVRHL
jgi:glycosyltransferase involved in cell wall biosynthesis